jgi:hypothetical protein
MTSTAALIMLTVGGWHRNPEWVITTNICILAFMVVILVLFGLLIHTKN